VRENCLATGEGSRPRLYVFSTCTAVIRTILAPTMTALGISIVM
jgi:hypothetical protein